MRYEYLEHTADIKFQAFGKTMKEAFSNSAYAMMNVIFEEKVREKIIKKIKINGIDEKSLLYNFLEEILFLLNTEFFLLSRIKKIEIKSKELTAELTGDNSKEYKLGLDIKAVTYNDMFIKKEKDKFTIQVVIDI
ncbi:archease [Candidatus Woesearchaeota archaeon]|nr:archease [Candidatus Woesearchaeota archaeon]